MSAVRKIKPATPAAPAQDDHVLLHDAVVAHLSREDALGVAAARYSQAWWLSADPYVIASYQLREPVLLVSFERLRRAVDLCLGYRVHVHEYLHPENLFSSVFRSVSRGFPASEVRHADHA